MGVIVESAMAARRTPQWRKAIFKWLGHPVRLYRVMCGAAVLGGGGFLHTRSRNGSGCWKQPWQPSPLRKGWELSLQCSRLLCHACLFSSLSVR